MSDGVFLPDEQEPECCRQLDLFIWGEAYAKARESAIDRIGSGDSVEQIARLLKWLPVYEAEKAVRRGTTMSWSSIRRAIWTRDNGICQVCGKELELDEYQCGHIVDRFLGGSDRLSNLVCMCWFCNQSKPFTPNRVDYVKWVKSGGAYGELARKMKDD